MISEKVFYLMTHTLPTLHRSLSTSYGSLNNLLSRQQTTCPPAQAIGCYTKISTELEFHRAQVMAPSMASNCGFATVCSVNHIIIRTQDTTTYYPLQTQVTAYVKLLSN